MEFHEKLQELRKKRGLTQEELAQALYVSRTAVSKWESGRGYPSIDSLKEIARFFSISIDELLNGEELLDLAQKENTGNVQRMCGLVLGALDISAVSFALLPLYPHQAAEAVYAVSLFDYAQGAPWLKAAYWVFIVLLMTVGAVRLVLDRRKTQTAHKCMAWASMGLSLTGALLFAAAREAYAAPLAVLMLAAKWSVMMWMSRGRAFGAE